MFEKLFSPIQIRGMEMKNRVIMPAMGTKFSGKASFVTPQHIHYHAARAEGGTGLNIVEVCSVHTPSAPRGFLSISEDVYIPGLKELTDAIHSAGGKAGLQLWQGSLAVGMDQTAQMLFASDMPVSAEMTLPGMSVEQIKEIVDCYGKAAARAVKAGFDCIEFHCAHNYLPHSFLSGGINHRTDEYGGSLERRARFPLECIRAIRENIPETMPLFMRIGAQDDYLESGLTIEDVIWFCKEAGKAGVDVLDVSRGNIISPASKYEVPPIDIPQGFNIENAARIRHETGMLTIGVGRINTAELAEKILEEDKVDLVVMGRAQLADPEFCNKAKAGAVADIDYCVGCDQGCLDGFSNADCPHITCLRNPAVGREESCQIVNTKKPEKVLIAGGGIAGLEAAIVLAKRGHHAVLCETSGRLGGQFLTAGEAPRKAEMKAAVIAMGRKAERLGVDIHLHTTVTGELIRELKPHTVLNATGSEPVIPKIPGYDRENVINSHDVLDGKVRLSGNVVVIGSGMVGMEVAEYLVEKGCKVTALEMMKEYCADMGAARKYCVVESVQQAGIETVTEVTVTEIAQGKVVGEKAGETVEYPCDYAVLAIGARARDGSALEQAAREVGAGYMVIGDAGKARRALDAVREAYDAALSFDDPEVHAQVTKPQKLVFVTGATGMMGQETMKQLLERKNRFKVRILARPSDKNRELLKKYNSPSLEVVWGDMDDYDTLKRCVDGADYVLHIAAMVSPMSDEFPEKTLYTNIGSTLKLIKAIREQPDPDKVHFAYVGTVAETGGRTDPIHWGRVGDPVNPSIFDYYAISKVFSELAVYESGLKHWVSIRQTGMHPAHDSGDDPIVFHMPANNVLEWSTSIESGICMANLCEDWVPEDFWRKGYNLSSGAGYRKTTWELLNMSMGAFGIDITQLYDNKMLATYNFHGHYYSDADKLDDILHFRCIPAEQYWGGVQEEMRRMAANPMVAAMFPSAEQMRANYERIGHLRRGPYWMLENDEEDWIRAFWGSREKQQQIKGFDEGFALYHPSEEVTYLDHGYDEEKGLENLSLEDLQKAAAFRGGSCLEEKAPEDIYTPIRWKCVDGHEFKMSVNAALQGGHWCPKCLAHEWKYGKIAKKNPFYAQVWTPIHGENDDYSIPMEYSAYDVMEELKEKLSL
ncbi:FAD-dependent oxidoreductase [Faecalicatena sp. AGMB00832]|uniref:FAD-dependent oxidoreductase n=1 Tax=Faecalicatena faecalis TaxID=2726362 RepID=A0ABS6D0L6_9FIRM|nr:FAD-dependent oxidoreductase [Faecalicatena faecalis]MBU3875048.1 FAD-dependent oxidoreductase [Faecalicatena faecalis]